MTEMDLINILDDLDEEEFNNFKWYLKKETVGDIPPIKVHQLSKAERRDAVDLMVQKYEFSGAVGVTTSIFKKISRNDLVKKLPVIVSAAEGPGPDPGPDSGPAGTQKDDSGRKLTSVRTQFIDRVSEPVLLKVLDRLLEGGVITDDEVEFAGRSNRAERARVVIDMVRKKGSAASSALMATLCEVDPCLSAELKLK